jgi:hypothetical protein
MRDSRSGLSPGAKRSISLSIKGGKTLLRRKARPRKIIIVTETIEHASNGHMKRPPFAKNPNTVFTVSGVSIVIAAVIIRLDRQ